MKTKIHSALLRALLLAAALTGCVGSAIDGDIATVGRLSAARWSLAGPADDAEADREVAALLRVPLDADRAVRVALLGNRELSAKLEALGVARGRWMQAGAVANPTFEVEALPERESIVELRVEYAISSLVLAPMRSAAAAADMAAERYDAASAVVDLGFRARAALLSLQAAEQRLALTRRTIESLAASRDVAAAAREAGNIPLLEADRQELAHERARLAEEQASIEVLGARERLNRLFGGHAATLAWRAAPLPRVADVPMLPADAASRAVTASLELASIDHRIRAAGHRVRLADVEGSLPHTEIDVHVLRTRPEAEASGDGAWLIGGGASFDLPMLDTGRGNRRVAAAQHAVAVERRADLVQDIRSRARELVVRVRRSHAVASRLERTLVPKQRAVLEETLRHYNAMQIDLLDLLAAQRDLLELELTRVEAARAYWTAAAELDALVHGTRVRADAANPSNLDTSEPSSSSGDH